jgi:hypothetical protein
VRTGQVQVEELDERTAGLVVVALAFAQADVPGRDA